MSKKRRRRRTLLAEKDASSSPPLPAITRPTWLGKISRSSVTEGDLQDAREHIERNPDYAKNGWSPETLASYFKERKEAQSDTVLRRRKSKPARTNGWHNPHRWRR